jgi:hypothetical protein
MSVVADATNVSETVEVGKPWIERYRPKSLQEVSHQSEVVATLQNAVETGRLPHLLLYGPPGSGKVCCFGAAVISARNMIVVISLFYRLVFFFLSHAFSHKPYVFIQTNVTMHHSNTISFELYKTYRLPWR